PSLIPRTPSSWISWARRTRISATRAGGWTMCRFPWGHKMRRHDSVLLGLLIVSLLLSGCGGGSNGPTLPSGTGRAILHIVWPDRSKLIPVASNAIKVIFQRGGELVASQVLARPASGDQTTTSFDNLKVGNLTLAAA